MSSFQPTGESWRTTGPASGPRAGFSQRLIADIIDGFVLLIAYAVAAALLKLPGELIIILVTSAYCTLLEGGPSGQTLGKRAMRIRVTSIDTGYPLGYQRAFIRNLARTLSWIPFCLGYLWMLWSPEKQTWHDMIARAVVVPAELEPRAPS